MVNFLQAGFQISISDRLTGLLSSIWLAQSINLKTLLSLIYDSWKKNDSSTICHTKWPHRNTFQTLFLSQNFSRETSFDSKKWHSLLKIQFFVEIVTFFESKWQFEKCAKATLMIFPNDFNSLVNYFSFCMWLFHTATCFTVIIFRRKMPISQNPRLFKVPIILPYLISLIGCYLIAVPFFQVFIWSFSTHFSTFLNSTFSQEFDIGYIFALGWILFGYLLNISIKKVSCLGRFSIISMLCARWFNFERLLPNDFHENSIPVKYQPYTGYLRVVTPTQSF